MLIPYRKVVWLLQVSNYWFTFRLIFKTNCGASKNFPALNNTLGCPRVRCIDTRLVKIFPLNYKPNFSNILTYKICAKYGGVHSFGDIILVDGH